MLEAIEWVVEQSTVVAEQSTTGLEPWQVLALGSIFVWSGFVRSGLGFGGAVLSLPFFLLVLDDPLQFLPAISIHLLFFSSWIFIEERNKTPGGLREAVDWKTLGWGMKIMTVPKIIGVVGLLTIPPQVVSTIILLLVSVYALSYLLNRPFESKNPLVEPAMVALGGYASGVSLTGAPLIIPAFARRCPKAKLRTTLFVLWVILVIIKLVSLGVAGVDFRLEAQAWQFPCALMGHLLGQRFHARLVSSNGPAFFRVLGLALLLVAIAGLVNSIALG